MSELLSGPSSLGGLFENNDYTALPSPQSRSPEGMRYFSGGYNTFRYGTNRNFNFSSIQLEFPFQGLRDTPQSRNLFAATFVDLVQEYFLVHLNMIFSPYDYICKKNLWRWGGLNIHSDVWRKIHSKVSVLAETSCTKSTKTSRESARQGQK